MARLAPEFVGLLCCPSTGQRLSVAPDSIFETSPALESFRQSVQCWLLRADGRIAYPVRDGLPVLLAEEGVALSGNASNDSDNAGDAGDARKIDLTEVGKKKV